MKIQKTEYSTKLWLSASDTYNWAHRSGASWPCSFLSGKRLFAEFEPNGETLPWCGDLIDFDINDGRGDQDCPADEFNAITDDALQSGETF